MRVLIFGDSITQGFWDSEGGWAQRIRKSCDVLHIEGVVDDPPTLFNLGISGDTIQDVLNRFDEEAESRKGHGDVVIIFSIGINDSQLYNDEPVSSPERYQEQLHVLMHMARNYTDKILFVGLSPCDELKTTPVSWGSYVFTNERIQQFDAVLKSFCKVNELPYVELFHRFKEENEKRSLLPDGLHPNDAGHALIADIVKPELQKVLAK